MKALENLPGGYEKIYSLNLQNDKKTALIVNLLAIIIAAVMVAVALIFVPLSTLLDNNDLKLKLIKLVVILALLVSYMILHELVHGIAMRICGTKRLKFGFTGLYAFAGSDDYYNKKAYIFIALAPIVLWGVVLGVANFIVPYDWFWVVYITQVINISGAAGDLFVTVKFAHFPKDILINDQGISMDVYSKAEE